MLCEANQLAEALPFVYHLKQCPTLGDMFRAAVANSSELGKAVQVYLQRGSLVPNSTTEKVVQDSLEKGKQVENP